MRVLVGLHLASLVVLSGDPKMKQWPQQQRLFRRGSKQRKTIKHKEKLVVLRLFLGFFLVFHWIFVREGSPKIPSKYPLHPPKSFPYEFPLFSPLYYFDVSVSIVFLGSFFLLFGPCKKGHCNHPETKFYIGLRSWCQIPRSRMVNKWGIVSWISCLPIGAELVSMETQGFVFVTRRHARNQP